MSSQPVEEETMPAEVDFSKGVRALHHIPPGAKVEYRSLIGTNWKPSRSEELERLLDRLLSSPRLAFDSSLRSRLPNSQGIYAIRCIQHPSGVFLRAGRTKRAAGGLKQRVYQNHFMGNQRGNLRQQLVTMGCCSLEDTKDWIRENCEVQYVVIEDDLLRQWAEYYALSILQPHCCD